MEECKQMLTKEELELENDNLLFHYTTYSKGLNILIGNSLWAGQLFDMNDPLEFVEINKQSSSVNITTTAIKTDLGNQTKANHKRNNSIRILAFCVDAFHYHDGIFSNKFPVSCGNMLNHGWARSRMWAQYADNHKGVCLVFDKSKLISAAKNYSEVQTIYDKITYTNYMQDFQNVFESCFNSICNENDYYNFFMNENNKKFLFQKCVDFLNEQEFLFLFIKNEFEDNKSFVFDYLDSLEGVIVSQKFETLNFGILNRLAKEKNIPCFQLKWSYGTPEITIFTCQ